MRPGKKSFRAAAAQLPAVDLVHASEAWSHIETALHDAKAAGAELLVLPECSYPAYLLESVEHYESSEHLSSKTFLSKLSRRVQQAGLHVICGFVEEAEGHLHNSAVFMDPKGEVLGIYRKSFLWGDDQKYFAPGARIDVFDSELGRAGIAICADLRHPEIMACLADQGAEFVAVPTCWVIRPQRSADGWPSPQPEILVPARASEFGLPLICANKFGAESSEITYCGLSRIVSSEGAVLAEADEISGGLITAAVERGGKVKHSIPTWAAARILTPEPAMTPPREEQETFKLAILPESLIDRKRGVLNNDQVLDSLLDEGAEVLVAYMGTGAKAERFELQMRAMGLTLIASPSDYRVMYDWFGSYGCVAGEAARSFAPLRALALDGAALLVAFDAPDDLTLLRARALENRCFLAATSAKWTVCIDPNGNILGRTDSADASPLCLTVELAQSANKEVFANTDIWNQRRPHVYAAATHLGLDV